MYFSVIKYFWLYEFIKVQKRIWIQSYKIKVVWNIHFYKTIWSQIDGFRKLDH